jgi:hypothetical protein
VKAHKLTVKLEFPRSQRVSLYDVEKEIKCLFPALNEKILFKPRIVNFYFGGDYGDPSIEVEFDDPQIIIAQAVSG